MKSIAARPIAPSATSSAPIRSAASVIGARVGGRGRKAAADAAVVLEDLVVRGDDPRAARARARAGRSGCAAPARRSAPRRSRRRARGARSSRRGRRWPPAGASRRRARRSSAAPRGCPVRPRPRSSTIALPSPETPSSSLTTTCPMPRPDGAQARDRGDHVGAAADVLDPERVRDAGAREQLAPAALGARGGRARGRRPGPGCRAPCRARTRARCVTYGTRWAASWSVISQRMRVSSVGRSSSFAESGRSDGSSALSIVSRSRASSRMSAGSSAEVVLDDRPRPRAWT